MQTDRPSIILISQNSAIETGLKAALEAAGSGEVTVQPRTLTQVNGAAVEMARTHGMMIFHLAGDTDLQAVRTLRGQIGGEGTLVAVTEADLPLAKALELKALGIDEILPYPLPEPVLRQQITALLGRGRGTQLPAVLGGGAPTASGTVVSVVPVRGGIGASTLAVNLAHQLRGGEGVFRKTAKARVALVDLDLQFGSVGSALDLAPSDTLFRMASEGLVPDRTFLGRALASHDSGLRVLTAPQDFAPLESIKREQVDALLVSLQQDFDYIVVDLPRTLTDWIAPVVNRSASLLMVTDSSVPSIRQAYRLSEFFKGERYDAPIEMVVNFEKKPMFPAAHHTEAAKVLGRPLKHWLPPDAKAARMALDRGVPLAEVSRGSPLRKAIRTLAEHLSAQAATRQTRTAEAATRG